MLLHTYLFLNLKFEAERSFPTHWLVRYLAYRRTAHMTCWEFLLEDWPISSKLLIIEVDPDTETEDYEVRSGERAIRGRFICPD